MLLMLRKLLVFLMRGAVFESSYKSSAVNRFELLRHDFLFYSFGVVFDRKFSFSFSSGIYWLLPKSNLLTWLKLGLNLILSALCLTIFPSMSLIEATLMLDFRKKPDFSPGLLKKIKLPSLALMEDRRKMLFLDFSCDFVKMSCWEALKGSVFLISSSSASNFSSYSSCYLSFKSIWAADTLIWNSYDVYGSSLLSSVMYSKIVSSLNSITLFLFSNFPTILTLLRSICFSLEKFKRASSSSSSDSDSVGGLAWSRFFTSETSEEMCCF